MLVHFHLDVRQVVIYLLFRVNLALYPLNHLLVWLRTSNPSRQLRAQDPELVTSRGNHLGPLNPRHPSKRQVASITACAVTRAVSTAATSLAPSIPELPTTRRSPLSPLVWGGTCTGRNRVEPRRNTYRSETMFSLPPYGPTLSILRRWCRTPI